jgi:hypothetical protein
MEMGWTYAKEGKRINRNTSWCWHSVNCFLGEEVEPKDLLTKSTFKPFKTIFTGRTRVFRIEE